MYSDKNFLFKITQVNMFFFSVLSSSSVHKVNIKLNTLLHLKLIVALLLEALPNSNA